MFWQALVYNAFHAEISRELDALEILNAFNLATIKSEDCFEYICRRSLDILRRLYMLEALYTFGNGNNS